MPLYFLDTSALVKRYHLEKGSDAVNRLFADPENVFAVADIAMPEFTSAFTRKLHAGDILEKDLHACLSEFSKDALLRFWIIDLERSHVSKSISLIIKHNLRTLDSLQLSVFLSLAALNPTMVTSDNALAEASRNEGFAVITP
ncbi:MAG: PIN domain-containing protein [Nitrospirae bacterium]|nr:MAG: PIN domain-containing protein [Nitrospirota bacterium]